ncbi:aliphatic sulfonates ABC transporter substrate-binding protein, partial [Salinicoccus roseus]|nr:aliphatic sulfonates ABC transporter substrate-binding protein [Salinicoccus roseus]
MKKFLPVLTALLFLILAGCGGEDNNSAEETADEVRIAYFPNFTHIATIVALENGYFEEAFGEDVTIDTMT